MGTGRQGEGDEIRFGPDRAFDCTLDEYRMSQETGVRGRVNWGVLLEVSVWGEDRKTYTFVVVWIACHQGVECLSLCADHLHGVFEVLYWQPQGR